MEFIILFSDEVLNPKPEMNEDHSRMTRRAMMSTNVHGRSGEMRTQAQVQNIVVLSSARVGQSSSAKSSRRTKQSKMVHTDYTRGSDSEDSD